MKIDVLGVLVNTDTKTEILAQILQRLKASQKTFIVTPYSESLVAAQKDEEFKRVLNSADISLPDGVGVALAARWTKAGVIRERIPGREFVWDLARLASENNYSIFLLGGFDDTPQLAAAALKERFPNLRIAGTAAPDENSPFTPSLIKEGEGGVPDFLFVALGPIRQEKWIARNLPNLPVKLVIGLGGTFDYLAGKRPPAPRFWAQAGLEWLWRLITQPWRVGRIFRGVLGLIWYAIKKGGRGDSRE